MQKPLHWFRGLPKLKLHRSQCLILGMRQSYHLNCYNSMHQRQVVQMKEMKPRMNHLQ